MKNAVLTNSSIGNNRYHAYLPPCEFQKTKSFSYECNVKCYGRVCLHLNKVTFPLLSLLQLKEKALHTTYNVTSLLVGKSCKKRAGKNVEHI